MRVLSTKKRKVAAALGAGAIAVASAGTAIAFWSSGGTGSGSGTAASSNGAVTYVVTVADGIVPGGSEPVTYAAYNPGTSTLQVNNPTATITIDGTHATAGCLASWFAVGQPTQGATSVPALTNAGTAVTLGGGNLTFPDLPGTDQNSCKGAVVTVTVNSS
jgi:hypothetical protein